MKPLIIPDDLQTICKQLFRLIEDLKLMSLMEIVEDNHNSRKVILIHLAFQVS